MKTGLSESEAEAESKTQPIARPGIEHCHWFILPRLLAIPTMQFSLDRKRRSHKQNQCSASDSVGLIFTRSYRFTLLITTPSTTPPLVKTSLKYAVIVFNPEGEYAKEQPSSFGFLKRRRTRSFHIVVLQRTAKKKKKKKKKKSTKI